MQKLLDELKMINQMIQDMRTDNLMDCDGEDFNNEVVISSLIMLKRQVKQAYIDLEQMLYYTHYNKHIRNSER